MEFADLTLAERRVWRAFPAGRVTDFRAGADENPADGAGWGPERTVRAEALRTLLLADAPGQDAVPALRVVGARITGQLNLQYGTIPHAIRLFGCHFELPPFIYGARFRQLNLSGSYLPALSAATIRVDGVLRITGCRIPGQTELGGAHFTGAVFLDGADLGDADRGDGDRADGGRGDGADEALKLNHTSVGADVWAVGLTTRGGLLMTGARIEGALNLSGAHLRNPGGHALQANNLIVGADLQAPRLRTEGRLSLRGARIAGQLNLTSSQLANPDGAALRVSSAVAAELWLREAAPIQGGVNLRRSQFDLLHLAPETCPGEVRLDGLTYGSLAPRLPAAARLRMLESDADGYVPHAYEQLAASYRRDGDHAAARAVLLARQRRHRTSLPWYGKAWGYLQDATVGYGFRPTRAVGWLLALLAVGAIVYGLHHPRPLEAEKAPYFNPVVYSLDLLLPIIDFGQEKAYNPRGVYQWLSYLLIAAGWILATTVAAGLTRTLTRQ